MAAPVFKFGKRVFRPGELGRSSKELPILMPHSYQDEDGKHWSLLALPPRLFRMIMDHDGARSPLRYDSEIFLQTMLGEGAAFHNGINNEPSRMVVKNDRIIQLYHHGKNGICDVACDRLAYMRFDENGGQLVSAYSRTKPETCLCPLDQAQCSFLNVKSSDFSTRHFTLTL